MTAPHGTTMAPAPRAGAVAGQIRGWRPIFAQFWRGFVTPTHFAFAMILAVAVICVVLIVTLVTPDRLAGPLGAYLPRSTRDTEAFATREALRLARRPAGTAAASSIVIISDSVLAHALASDSDVAAAVTSVTGRPADVAILATPLQGPVDQAALADHASRSQPGIVVLGMDFEGVPQSAKGLIDLDRMGRIGLRSPWADAAVKRLGSVPRPLYGQYLVDNRNFALRNARVMAERWAVGQPATRRIDTYIATDLAPANVLSSVATIWRHTLRTSPRTLPADAILAETVGQLRARGVRVLLVESPVSDALLVTLGDRAAYAAHIGRSAALARSIGARYCQLASFYNPPPRAYGDMLHIADPVAQGRLREAFARCIAHLDRRQSS